MKLDITTLQAQILLLKKNGDDLQNNANTKLKEIENLTKQIDQFRGALAYNSALITQLESQISELSKITTELPKPQ